MRSPVIWIALAVMAVSAAVFVGRAEQTRNRIVAVEGSACQSPESCQRLLNRLLRYATPRQKRAVVQALPNIKERIRQQIPREHRPPPDRDVPQLLPRLEPPAAEKPASPQEPEAPPAGPRGPQGEKGEKGDPAVPVPEVPVQPKIPGTPVPIPPLPQPVCDLLPSLCPKVP